MKIVVDQKIPFIKEPICSLADEVIFVSATDFTPDLVKDADALVIRTRTRCDRNLLKGSRVQFIATATIGFDHIDTAYCQKAGIAWANAPGCNSTSVAQYVESALIQLQQQKGIRLSETTLGIIGVGNVGRQVAAVAQELGMKVLLNDPPRAQKEGSENFVSLSEIARACEIITFHVPLYKGGLFNTFHLADSSFFHSLKRCSTLINTSRGEVVETTALLKALEKGTVLNAIIDVWEGEPNIHTALLDRAFIATPHIAGYSADGKANATRMALNALCSHFHLQATYQIQPPPPEQNILVASTREEACLQMYDPHRDSVALKAHPELFDFLRENYPLRREKEAFTVKLSRF